MNPTIFLTTLRQRFTSRTRLALVGIVFLFPLAVAAFAHEVGFQAARTGTLMALLLGAGILGQESASGVMQLLFARPVRRWEFVVSRWLAVIAAASALVVAQLAMVLLVLASHGAPSAREFAVTVAEQILQVAGTTSVILLYSSLLSGIADVLGILLTGAAAQMIVAIGQFRQSEATSRVGNELLRFLSPQIQVGAITSGGSIPWFEVVSYLSTVTLGVAVAVAVLNRREISYASE